MRSWYYSGYSQRGAIGSEDPRVTHDGIGSDCGRRPRGCRWVTGCAAATSLVRCDGGQRVEGCETRAELQSRGFLWGWCCENGDSFVDGVRVDVPVEGGDMVRA